MTQKKGGCKKAAFEMKSRLNVHAGWRKSAKQVRKVHFVELATGLADFILPNSADNEVFDSVSRQLKMPPSLVLVAKPCRSQVFLRSCGKGAASFTYVEHHCLFTAEEAHDGVHNIC